MWKILNASQYRWSVWVCRSIQHLLKSSVMYRHGFLLAIMFCLSQNVVVAYPSGAPTTACDSMTPGHGTPSNVACPFVTIFDKVHYGCMNLSNWIINFLCQLFFSFHPDWDVFERYSEGDITSTYLDYQNIQRYIPILCNILHQWLNEIFDLYFFRIYGHGIR